MAVLFPKTYYCFRRGKGMYVNGEWIPPTNPAPEPIDLNIQPASETDYARLQSMPQGRRVTEMKIAIGGVHSNLHIAGEDGWPGDVIAHENANWLVIGRTKFDSLDGKDTAHCRYLLAKEIEYGTGESL